MIVKNVMSEPDDCFHLPGSLSWVEGDHRINLLVPDGPMPAGGWPSVWLVEADGCFATCVEAMRRMSRRSDATGVVPQVIVGINATDPDRTRRRRSFTTPKHGHSEAGGAEAFRNFLLDRVRVAVAARVTLDPWRATLWGHSLAGYFVLWVLATQPDAFSTYAAISPSTWWDRPLLERALRGLSGDRRVLVCIGEWEDALPPWQANAPGASDALARRQARQMVTGARDIAALLAGVLGEDRVQFRLLPEEDHASILSAAIPRMLRLASADGR
jgi:uncharacterized protein